MTIPGCITIDCQNLAAQQGTFSDGTTIFRNIYYCADCARDNREFFTPQYQRAYNGNCFFPVAALRIPEPEEPDEAIAFITWLVEENIRFVSIGDPFKGEAPITTHDPLALHQRWKESLA